MLKYDRVDISEGIDADKTNEWRECKFCNYWYFLNKNFSYSQFTCDGCYDVVQIQQILKILLFFILKKVQTELFSTYA